MSEFVRLLICASEKAANIARIIRSESELFQLLVEEKTDDQKNDRFVHDFKTLSDVLIQECLRHEISAVFTAMTNNIFGEESNTFTNVLGESITIEIKDSEEETVNLLSKVLNGNVAAAQILAKEVHRDISTAGNETSLLPNDLIDNYEDVGVWIDPIDGTNEYIRGSIDDSDGQNGEQLDEEIIWSNGLHCVTVLIGAFNLKTGQPIVGVINQPFWKFDRVSKKWQGRKFWGVSTATQLASSVTRYPLHREENSKKVIISSSSEDGKLKDVFGDEFNFVFSSGAGYKLLCVALGLADIYILTKPTVHYWDTCGPHAILNSLGGGIINYKNMILATETDDNDTQSTHQLIEELMSTATTTTESAKVVQRCDQNGGNKNIKTDVDDCLCISKPKSSYSASNSSGSSSSSSAAITRLRKISSSSEITYSMTKKCDTTTTGGANSIVEHKFIHLGGIFAYRESQTANLAIDCLKRNVC